MDLLELPPFLILVCVVPVILIAVCLSIPSFAVFICLYSQLFL